jgi:hypothetical protein
MDNYPDLHGWDTVFAVSIDVVNVALAKLPASSRYRSTLPVTNGSASADWSFQKWRITDTPRNNGIEITLDFALGSTLTRVSDDQSTVTSLGEAPVPWSCAISFAAHFDETDPTLRRLVAVTSSGVSWAAVVVNPPDSSAPFADVATLQLVIQTWFDSDPAAVALFEQEFYSIDMGLGLGTGTLAWLKPVKHGYAGALMADRVTKALGILAMTDPSHSPSAATLALSPYAILPGANAAFLVSRELVLQNMVAPACASTFSIDGVGRRGADGRLLDFEVSLNDSGALRVTNTADLNFKQAVDGVDRDAILGVNALQLTLNGDLLQMRMAPMVANTEFDGITFSITLDESLTMSVVDNPDQPGSKLFLLNSVRPAQPKVEVETSHVVKAIEAAAAVAALALGSALTVATFKGPLAQKLSAASAKIWARIISIGFGAVGFVGSMTAEWIRLALEGRTNTIPDLAPALTSGLVGMKWPGGSTAVFVVKQGQFANCMLITVDPKF